MIALAAAIPSYNFPIPKGSFFDLLFHQTSLSLQVLGLLHPPFSINLIGLIIIVLIAFAANAIRIMIISPMRVMLKGGWSRPSTCKERFVW